MSTDASHSALAVARRAQRSWAQLTVTERSARLSPLASLIAQGTDEIADQIRAENGKPLTEAIAHEVLGSIKLVEHHCSTAPRVLGTRTVRAAMSPHRRSLLERRPYGVILAIAPWNLPWIIPFSQVLPGLLAGNAVILKPSELTPVTGELLGELVGELDLPEGLLQVISGDGRVGAELISAGPDKVLFTGSVATGRKVMRSCADHPIPVALELGGIDAMIVRSDADLEFAASAATWGATFNGGQSCCSVERLLVHESVAERLRVRIVDKFSELDPADNLAPAIDDRQLTTWLDHLADARGRGLDVEPPTMELPGRRITPAVVHGTGLPDSDIWRRETFGPVVALQKFHDDDEAVRIHNASEFGLTASIITSDRAAGRDLARRLRAGSVAINEVAATLYGSPELPWGGVGASGFGRSHGEDGLLESSWVQVIDEPVLHSKGPKRPWWYPYDTDQAAALAALARSLGQPARSRRLIDLTRSAGSLLGPLSRRARL